MQLSTGLHPAVSIKSHLIKHDRIGFAPLSRQNSTLRCHLPFCTPFIGRERLAVTRTAALTASHCIAGARRRSARPAVCQAFLSSESQSTDTAAATAVAYAKLQNGSDIRGFALDSKC